MGAGTFNFITKQNETKRFKEVLQYDSAELQAFSKNNHNKLCLVFP